jgi:hypothetical protein
VASTVDKAGRSCSFKHDRSFFPNETENFASDGADFPLGPAAETHAQEMENFPGVHGHDELSFPRVRQDIAGIFFVDSCIEQLLVCPVSRRNQVLEDPAGPRTFSYRGGNNAPEVRFPAVTLAPLAEGSQPVTHQLVGGRPADSIDGKRKGNMFEGGKVAAGDEMPDQAPGFLRGKV